MCMKCSSAKFKTVYVPLSATFDIVDTLPKHIRQKLKALGIPITKNMTVPEALSLIAEKEAKIKKEKTKNLKKEINQDAKLTASLEMLSMHNKLDLKMKSKKSC